VAKIVVAAYLKNKKPSAEANGSLIVIDLFI